jgi:hypothetical protein
MTLTEEHNMENRTPVDFKFESVFFFEAKIAKKGDRRGDNVPVQIITSKNLREVELDINIWLKCGNYSLLSVERVERQQISLS